MSAHTHVERDGDGFVIPADIIAGAFGLAARDVPGLMRAGRITSRTERGADEHAGRWRLTLFHDGRALRLSVDETGMILSRATYDAARNSLAVPDPRPDSF